MCFNYESTAKTRATATSLFSSSSSPERLNTALDVGLLVGKEKLEPLCWKKTNKKMKMKSQKCCTVAINLEGRKERELKRLTLSLFTFQSWLWCCCTLLTLCLAVIYVHQHQSLLCLSIHTKIAAAVAADLTDC